ncbi:MAG: P1 family peptidase, partial [Chloroflexota bacterium]
GREVFVAHRTTLSIHPALCHWLNRYVVATDAPCSPSQLARVARRVPFGLARTGTTCAAGSGDFAIAFSTVRQMGLPDTDDVLDELFTATVEAVEEAILNALLQAHTVTGKDGNTLYGFPVERLAVLW